MINAALMMCGLIAGYKELPKADQLLVGTPRHLHSRCTAALDFPACAVKIVKKGPENYHVTCKRIEK